MTFQKCWDLQPYFVNSETNKVMGTVAENAWKPGRTRSRERTLPEWQSLLDQSGFVLNKVLRYNSYPSADAPGFDVTTAGLAIRFHPIMPIVNCATAIN